MVESRRRKKFRRLRDFGKRLAVWLVPPLYNAYMWLVYNTSKEAYSNLHIVWEALDRGENILAAVWHQEAVLGPFLGRGRDIVTMVSRGDFGNVATEMIRRLHFIPVRGGSGDHGMEALGEIIEYINARKGVICGIAVDGSRGPARKVQIGIVLMAKATGAPIYPVRLNAKRKLFAPTWDKTTIPLPFNQLVFMVGEPIKVAPDAGSEELEGHRAELERRLNELVTRSENILRKELRPGYGS
jgi:lysophospholipid acyltransferase (LPLAT)-like uncharacterized protein